MATKTDESAAGTEAISPEQFAARQELERKIQERGIKPMTVEKLRSMGDLWPQDEEVDDFLAAVRDWRREGWKRSEP